MKLKDLKIDTKMRLGLGSILLLVMVLAFLARLQTNTLWFNTKELYDHPLQVRRALDTLTSDILAMRQDMTEVVRAESDQERLSLRQSIDIHEAGATRQFEILHGRYLGPQSDIDEAEQAFIQWKAVREETRRLLREGKTAEASKRTRPNGAESIQLEKIMNEIGHVSVFAKKRGDAFYAAAEIGRAHV